MTHISTISELFNLSGSQYRIYDIGRKIDKISKEKFEKIEQNQLPYPFPSQSHAFIALAFWQKPSGQPYLWFVKLPLDERGLLNQGARNHFIAIIIEALGSDLTLDPTEQQQKLLSNNPYHFTPSQYKLASINSIIKVELKQAPSEYFALCQDFIAGKLGWDNWQQIGVQGITDFAARIHMDGNASLLEKALPYMPEQVLLPLCSSLENEKLSLYLIKAIIDRIKTPLPDDNELVRNHLLRSLASCSLHPDVESMMDDLIKRQALTTDDFITITGRCWQLLQQTTRMMAFLELLLKTQDSSLFSAIFKDLVAIPGVRPVIFQCMRDPARSSEFAKAIGQLFNQAQG